jgi:hypothetical protein
MAFAKGPFIEVIRNDVATAVGSSSPRKITLLGKGNEPSTVAGAIATRATALATINRRQPGLDWHMAPALGRTDGPA